MTVTTVSMSKGMKERLDSFKLHQDESYEQLMHRVLDNCNLNTVLTRIAEALETTANAEVRRNQLLEEDSQ